jgi:prevent-host-death family protein
MSQVNIGEAKTHLSKLIQRVIGGEVIIIARSGEPVARLAPVGGRRRKARVPGRAKGIIRIHDDFDAPLPDNVFHPPGRK